jgi:hypothetical protein
MAANPDLAARVRAALAGDNVHEVPMFGGLGFMLNGNMVAAASSRGLLARVGRAQLDQALAHPGTSIMEMRGRPMADYIRVAPDALSDATVEACLALARAFVATLPPDSGKKRTKKA